MSALVMPSLGADMEAATLLTWRVKPGDVVTRGDVVAEVDTDKGVIEIECFQSGTVKALVATPGTKVPVGAVLATLRGANDMPEARAVSPPPPGPAPQASAAPMPVPSPAAAASTHRRRVSPLARSRAKALGVDLGAVVGTGPGGAIEAADVDRASAAASTPSVAPHGVEVPDGRVVPMRRAIASAMAKSKREIPHYYLQTRIDMSRATEWLRTANATRPLERRLLSAVVLLKGVAAALRDVPALNGFWIDGAFRPASGIHLGFAIALRGGGLIAPAIHDVDRASPDALMAMLHDLIPRAQEGRLRSSELSDATLTVTSLGDRGAEGVFGVIYPPQVALVGFGRISEQPWAEHGMVGARPAVMASLAADHRATDGHLGARFLDALGTHLQHPEAW